VKLQRSWRKGASLGKSRRVDRANVDRGARGKAGEVRPRFGRPWIVDDLEAITDGSRDIE